MPVVATNSLAAGTFLIGDFPNAAQIFQRQEAVVEISTEHSDFFTRNLVAIRCEERIAIVVYKPAALVTGSFV